MRVLHVVPSFFPATAYGGPLESVFQLCRNLAAQGHIVRVLTTDADGPNHVLRVPKHYPVTVSPGVTVRYFRRIGRHAAAPGLLGLLPAAVAWADVVHLTGVYSFPTLPTLAACRVEGKPLVWSPRGSLQRWRGTTRGLAKDVWEAMCRALLPRSVILHATSDDEAQASHQRLRRPPITVIPNGVTLPDSPSHVNDPERLRLLFLGRLDPIKGLERLLEACAMLDESALPRPWRLTIAGHGSPAYQQSLEQLVHTLHLDGRVLFAGQVGEGAKGDLFAHSDLLILPSHSENFGLVVAEALAHGVPVVASRGTPWRDVERVGCGRWVDNAPPTLAAAMRELAQSSLCDRGLAGRHWIEREFAWPAIAARMSEQYSAMVRAMAVGR